MNILNKHLLFISIFCIVASQGSFAANSDLLQSLTHEAEQFESSILLAEVFRGVERRSDRRDNAGDRVEDKQDFREERRDCVGDGADCRSDNRQDNRTGVIERRNVWTTGKIDVVFN